MKRDRGLKHVTTTAKEIMREALPIQCVEAVFLAILLTSEAPDLCRFPLSFKSKCDGNAYRHIVLAIREAKDDRWGALGISRRKTLQGKEVRHESLAALVDDYRRSYESCGHELVKVYVGLPLPCSVHSMEPVKWRVLKLRLDEGKPWADAAGALDRYVKDSGWIKDYHARTGKLPDPFGKGAPDAAPEPGAAAAAAPGSYLSPSRVARKASLPAAASAPRTTRRRHRPKKAAASPGAAATPAAPSPAPAPAPAAPEADEAEADAVETDAETEPEPEPGDAASDTSDSDAEDV